MGYVHDTKMAQFIPPVDFHLSAGTWTLAESSDVVRYARSSADASFSAWIPIKIPSNANALKGAKLTSIDVGYLISTAADDFATVELHKTTINADDAAASGESVDITIDEAHDTAAERKAADDHTMTITIDDPEYLDDGDMYYLELVVDAAAGTLFSFFGAVAHFTFRA